MSGLFGELIGSVLGGAAQGATSGGGNSAVIQAVIGLIQQHGGVGGLVEQFQKAGLGSVVQSWVGTGQNLPIDPAQLTQVLGGAGGGLGGLGQIAQALGLDHGQLGGLLSEVLPQVVDQMTPNGRIEPGAGAGADALGSLAQQLGGKLFG